MKGHRLKKVKSISLIVFVFCIVLNSLNSYFDIDGLIDLKLETLKEKEMELIYGRYDSKGDVFISDSSDPLGNNVAYKDVDLRYVDNNLTSSENNGYQDYMIDHYSNTNTDFRNGLLTSKKESILLELRNLIKYDSFRHRKLGFYYVFNFDYTMNALEKLDDDIQTTSAAQHIPKALVAAVLFREMMFLGQEDLLDGAPFIGGKSLGICQIGIENVRSNELIVHGYKSLIIDKTDEEIMEMLQSPERAVYFCAVQLRARAIKITKNNDVDLNKLTKDEIIKVLEEYNQSKISITIGPVKSKAKYAEETYKYYELFSKYYGL